MTGEGKLKVYKLGRQRRYRQRDLDASVEPGPGVSSIPEGGDD